ncbi:MAG: hypothetical protein AAF340_15555, partial [Pseudomonadota bacterium]
AAAGAANERDTRADAMMVFILVSPVCVGLLGRYVCGVLPFDEMNMRPVAGHLNTPKLEI